MEDLRQAARADLQDRLREFVRSAVVHDMPDGIEVEVQEGPSVESILERAATLSADLVVMGPSNMR
jgi:nucleotide-binding universal stress UspA family protein